MQKKSGIMESGLDAMPLFLLDDLLRGFAAISAGKTCNIRRDFPAICKYYRVFPADIAEKTLNHPVNHCKHLQCGC